LADVLLGLQGRDSGPALVPVRREFARARNPDSRRDGLARTHVLRTTAAFVARLQGRAASPNAITSLRWDKPTRPATDYVISGLGNPIGNSVHKVASFVDKPYSATAQRYLAEGYLWNSGNLLFRARLMLRNLDRWDAKRSSICPLGERAKNDLAFVILDKESFEQTKIDSIDCCSDGETSLAAVIHLACGWSRRRVMHMVQGAFRQGPEWQLRARPRAVFESSQPIVRSIPAGRLRSSEGVEDLVIVATQDPSWCRITMAVAVSTAGCETISVAPE